MSGLYVFALTSDTVGSCPGAGPRLEFVALGGGVYAAVERLDAPPAATEEALRRQHDVVAALAACVEGLLPARFGAFADASSLEAVVSRSRDAVLDAFALVRGRRQMTLRLRGPEPSSEAAEAPASVRTGTEYLEARRRESPVPLPLLAAREAVRPFVRAERTAAGKGPVAGTLYHLVDREDADAYREAIARLPAGPGGLLTVSGPWAPFAFAPDLWS